MFKSFLELNKELWKNRKIVYEMGKTEFRNEYVGSAFGIVWGLLKPFIMVAFYRFDPVLYTQNYMGEVIKKFTFRANGSLNEEFYYNQAGHHTHTNLFRDGTVYEKRVVKDIWRVVYMQRDTKNNQDIVKEVVEYNANGGRTAIHWFDPVLYTQNYMGEVIRTFTFRANGSLNEEFFYNQAGHNTSINVFFDGTNYETRVVSNIWKAITMARDTQHNQDILNKLVLYQQSPHKHCKTYAFEPVLYIQDYMSKAHLRDDFCGTSWHLPVNSGFVYCILEDCYDGAYGARHNGTDISNNGGALVFSLSNGVVDMAKDFGGPDGLGKTVGIKYNVNGTSYYAVYSHLESYNVSVGQSVSGGQQIGVVGQSGCPWWGNCNRHLHIEVQRNVTYFIGSGEERRKYSIGINEILPLRLGQWL